MINSVRSFVDENYRETILILFSAVISVLLFMFQYVTVFELVVAFYFQTLILIPISIVRDFKHSVLQGIFSVVGWLFALLGIVWILENAFNLFITYGSFNNLEISSTQGLVVFLFVVIGLVEVYFSRRKCSNFELNFLNSVILRRFALLTLAMFVGVVSHVYLSPMFGVLCFVTLETIFDFFVLRHTLSFR